METAGFFDFLNLEALLKILECKTVTFLFKNVVRINDL